MASNFHSLQISTASLQRKRKNRNWKNFVKKVSNLLVPLPNRITFIAYPFLHSTDELLQGFEKNNRNNWKEKKTGFHARFLTSIPISIFPFISRDIPSINPAFRRVRLGIGPSVGWKGRVGRDRLRFAGRSTKEDDRRGRRCVGDNPFQRSHGF